MAICSCVSWRYFLYYSTGPFCLVVKHVKEHRPCRVCDTFCQAMIFHHVQNHQIFYADDAKLIDDLATFLMSKISSFVCDPFVYASNSSLASFAFLRSFSSHTQFLLCFRQSLLFCTQELRIINLSSITQSSETAQPNISSHRFFTGRQGLGFNITRKDSKPFTSSIALDCAGLNVACHR